MVKSLGWPKTTQIGCSHGCSGVLAAVYDCDLPNEWRCLMNKSTPESHCGSTCLLEVGSIVRGSNSWSTNFPRNFANSAWSLFKEIIYQTYSGAAVLASPFSHPSCFQTYVRGHSRSQQHFRDIRQASSYISTSNVFNVSDDENLE